MSFVKDGASSNDAALICEFNVSPSGCAHNRTEPNNSNTYMLSTENSIAKLACSSILGLVHSEFQRFSVWAPGESWLKFDAHEAGDLSPLLLNDSAGVERFLFISIVINSGSLSLRWLKENLPASRTTCLAKGNSSSRRVSKAGLCKHI
ncbi:hypothetical protein T07_13806 [Trichinella nelsoni]|uniref:Uncharacterized protein n=1 Tax=Trichinella nelsoni TaxID=6336 RepID=A0A0V0RZB0_9BILA|nr:hypothetical protein T07_13806 [Trichinella nelsoni]